MAPAPCFWQQFSSLSWGSKPKHGLVLQPPTTAAQHINTNQSSWLISMNTAGFERGWWKGGHELLSISAGIRAIISSKRTKQIPRDSDPINYLSEHWQGPSEHTLRAHHSSCEEWAQTASVPSVFILPYHMLISPHKQAFGCPLESACSTDICQSTLKLWGVRIGIKDAPVI